MNIAYFSPLNPVKSGISDFSEELVMELKKYINIDIFVDGYKPTNNSIVDNFSIYNIQDIYKKEVRSKYDLLVYHIGNNAAAHSRIVKAANDFPGICELHDISLHHLLAEETVAKNNIDEYIRIMKYCHGCNGEERAISFINGLTLAPWEYESLKFTVSKHIIDNAKAVIVHSDMAKQTVLGINPNMPIINIPLHTFDIIDDYDLYKKECRAKLDIDQDLLILASFGFASQNKRILQILEALSMIKKKNLIDFRYYIVGEVHCSDLDLLISSLGLEGNILVTGYTQLDEFRYYMGACDIALNLRYPTQGESSASLHRLLGMGKPVIVTDIGSFQEYPDDVVIKVSHGDSEVNEIYNAICGLANDDRIINERRKNSYNYAKEYCNIYYNALKYVDFFKKIIDNTYQEDEIDHIISKLFDIGLIYDEYVEHLVQNRLGQLLYANKKYT